MGSSLRVLLLLVLGLFLAMSLGAEVAVGFEGESLIYYESLLDRFGAAWNEHDAEALISMMTPNAVFRQSAGPEGVFTGTEVIGHTNLKKAFETTFNSFPDAKWAQRGAGFVISSGAEGVWRGVSEWTFQGTRAVDGAKFDTNGVDIFTFKDGLIAIKDAYRKDVPPTTKVTS